MTEKEQVYRIIEVYESDGDNLYQLLGWYAKGTRDPQDFTLAIMEEFDPGDPNLEPDQVKQGYLRLVPFSGSSIMQVIQAKGRSRGAFEATWLWLPWS